MYIVWQKMYKNVIILKKNIPLHSKQRLMIVLLIFFFGIFSAPLKRLKLCYSLPLDFSMLLTGREIKANKKVHLCLCAANMFVFVKHFHNSL